MYVNLEALTPEQMVEHWADKTTTECVDEFYSTAKWLIMTDDIHQMPVMISWMKAIDTIFTGRQVCRPMELIRQCEARLAAMQTLCLGERDR